DRPCITIIGVHDEASVRCSPIRVQNALPQGPTMDFKPSDRARQTADKVRAFIKTHIEPVEHAHWEGILDKRHGGDWTQWTIPPLVEELKAKARAEGLWNLFMPDPELGAGLSVLEYAFSAEETGRSLLAPEIF